MLVFEDIGDPNADRGDWAILYRTKEGAFVCVRPGSEEDAKIQAENPGTGGGKSVGVRVRRIPVGFDSMVRKRHGDLRLVIRGSEQTMPIDQIRARQINLDLAVYSLTDVRDGFNVRALDLSAAERWSKWLGETVIPGSSFSLDGRKLTDDMKRQILQETPALCDAIVVYASQVREDALREEAQLQSNS